VEGSDVRIISIFEIEAGALIQSIIPQASSDKIAEIKWLQPHFASADGQLKAVVQSFIIEVDGQSITKMDWEGTFLLELLLTPLMLALLVPFLRRGEQMTVTAFSKCWLLPTIWGAAVIQMIGLLAVNLGLSKAPSYATVIIPVSTIYPILTTFLAFWRLRERIPVVPLVGGMAGVLGVVILSLG
jgi:drug/metabolite transporter (DMT)-like permease